MSSDSSISISSSDDDGLEEQIGEQIERITAHLQQELQNPSPSSGPLLSLMKWLFLILLLFLII